MRWTAPRSAPSVALGLVLLCSVLAGCLAKDDAATGTASGAPRALEPPTFAAPKLIDDVRAGGEPVIAVTHDGSLIVSAHPGFTHYHPSDDPTHPGVELVSPVNGQSYMWRSTDGGASWSTIDLVAGAPNAPRSAGLGVSDPEFTVMADGAICFTDLESLVLASTSCSLDDGVTWGPGNPAASGRPVDRQWLASYGDEFYFTANYLSGGANFRVSTDKGLTWTDRGTTVCSSDLVADPATGHLVQACNGSGISVSTDGGRTWSDGRGPPGATSGGARIMAEPAIDSDGNAWITWTDGERDLWLAGTPDEGAIWPWVWDLTPTVRQFTATAQRCTGNNSVLVCPDPSSEVPMAVEPTNGTYVWPWVSAGSAGRVAVSAMFAFDTQPSDAYEGAWYILTVYAIAADTMQPQLFVAQPTPDPIHVGPICQSGTTCQVASVTGDDTGDRRLGDFFETTVEPATGYLLGVWSNTHERPDDVISHPQFVRQTGGVRLISDDLLGTFTPTQG